MKDPLKVDWDTYFMTHCFLVSMRSIDPSTKHGCVIVDEYNRILATGYNGPLAGVDDSQVPLTRPEKYYYLPHAEENAILSLDGAKLPNAKLYVTGRPCHKCMRMILQKGIRHIIYGPQNSKMMDETETEIVNNMVNLTETLMVEYTDLENLREFSTDLEQRIRDF